MFSTASLVAEGDFESWFEEWNRRAKKTLSRADADLAGDHPVSARESYLRTSTYFRMAEFYLHGDPDDPRILETAKASDKAYAEAARLTGPTWEPVEIPYEGTTLPGYFYKVDDSGRPRPTVIFNGGIDSSREELFYFGAAAAVRRGYNCLTYDGPGQGLPAREQKLFFRYDWEKVVTAGVDYALTRSDVDADRLALIVMSLGGYFAARAVAFEHRFKAAVFFGGVYDLYGAFKNMLPAKSIEAYEAGDFATCEKVTAAAMEKVTAIKWAVMQGIWSFGATDLIDFMDKAKLITLESVAHLIRCPCLVLDSENDQFFRGQPEQVHAALISPKTLFRFTQEDGAENHCQSGALGYKDEVVFNWLDDILRS